MATAIPQLFELFPSLPKLEITMGADSAPVTVEIDKSLYPKVDYWYKKDWTNKGTVELALDINAVGAEASAAGDPPEGSKQQRYIQHEDGSVITTARSSALRRHARHLFDILGGQGLLRKTWGQVPATSQNWFQREMESSYSELRLCQGGWKAHQVAIDTFPAFIKYQQQYLCADGQTPTVKIEAKREDPDPLANHSLLTPLTSNPLKRPSSPTVTDSTDRTDIQHGKKPRSTAQGCASVQADVLEGKALPRPGHPITHIIVSFYSDGSYPSPSSRSGAF